jgi:ADP-ribose pyrophosphatase YjhB (NUDIX family)
LESAGDRRRGLGRRLQGYRPGDEEEAASLEQLSHLLSTPGDPFSPDRFDPGHVTASAFVLAPDLRSLLLIFHEQLSRWLQPGGHVEPEDDEIVGTARREVCEETGLQELVPLAELTGVFDVDVHPIPTNGELPAHRHYDVRWLFRANATDLRAGSDVKIARWVPLDRVLSLNDESSMRRAMCKLNRVTPHS